MLNISLWLLLMITDFLLIIGIYRIWGKTGLYVWAGFAIIIANIQVLKTIQLFGLVSTLGNIIYGTTFLTTDILSEIYGKKESRKAVWIGFYTMVSMTILMQISLLFIPDKSDFAQESLKTIFGIMPRIMVASLTAYLVSQNHDIWAFHFWKNSTANKYLWLRNNASTMVSQAIDTIIFCSIAFIGLFPWHTFFQIVITTYIFKWIVAASDTPFVYWARRLHSKGRVETKIKIPFFGIGTSKEA
ncbi:MAG: queuosine precursor transporter [Spirochaetales bacterium]|nr:queuosine precursor transporter [Spirochaetales bacterium]